MARAISTKRKTILSAIAWAIGFLIFFPILWTFLTGFKTEEQAITSPPVFLFFDWNLSAYEAVQRRTDYFKHFMNSVVISFGSTLVGLAIAIPAAWAMAFVPGKQTKNILMWMLSTKMLPPVGVLIPIYLIFRDTGLLDTRTGLVIILTLINLPIMIWMLYTTLRKFQTIYLRRHEWMAQVYSMKFSMCSLRWHYQVLLQHVVEYHIGLE